MSQQTAAPSTPANWFTGKTLYSQLACHRSKVSSAVRSDVVNCLLANFEESQHCGSETPWVTYLFHTSTTCFYNSFNTAGEDGAEVASPLMFPFMFIPY